MNPPAIGGTGNSGRTLLLPKAGTNRRQRELTVSGRSPSSLSEPRRPSCAPDDGEAHSSASHRYRPETVPGTVLLYIRPSASISTRATSHC